MDDITLRITADASQAQQALGEVKAGLRGVVQEADGSITSFKTYDEVMRRLSAPTLAQLQAGLIDEKQALEQLQAEIDKTAKATQDHAKSNETLTASLVKLAGGMALGASIKKTLEFADALDEMSQRAGMSVEEYQRLSFAAKQHNVEMGRLTSSIQMLQDRIAGGDKSALGALEKMGLSFETLRTESPHDQVLAIADGIQKMGSHNDQVAALNDLFGRAGKELLPLMLDNVRQLEAAAPVMGDSTAAALARANDQLDALKGSAIVLLAELLKYSGIVGIFDMMAQSVSGLKSLMADFWNGTINGANEFAKAMDANPIMRLLGIDGSAFRTSTAPPPPPSPNNSNGGALPKGLLPGETTDTLAAKLNRDLQTTNTTVRALTASHLELQRAEDATWKAFATDVAAANRELGQTQTMIGKLAPELWALRAGPLRNNAGKDFFGVGSSMQDVLLRAGMGGAPNVKGVNVTEPGGILSGGKGGKGGSIGSLFGAGGIFGGLSQTILGALTGGGNVGQSVGGLLGGNVMGKLLSTGIGKSISGALGGVLGSVLPGIGNLIGAGLGKLIGGLFGPSKRQKEGKAADASIQGIQQQLLDQYGSLQNIDQMGKAIGVDLAAAWGDKNVAGLAHFQGMVEQFTGKWTEHEAQLQAVADATAAVEAKYGAMTDGIKSQIADIDSQVANLDASEAPEKVMGVIEKAQRASLAAQKAQLEQSLADTQTAQAAAMKVAAEAGTGAFDKTAESLRVGLPAAADDAIAAVRGKFDNFTLTVRASGSGGSGDGGGPPGGGRPPGYAQGGMVYAASGWMPRGTDTVPAMLTPGEGVLSRRGIATLGRLNHGQAGPVEQTIQILLDGRLIAQATARELPRLLKVKGAA